MKTAFSVFISLCVVSFSFAEIPLSSTPSWSSTDDDYSTGGALYDVTNDGWIDYCTGNGNDMASNTNAIYVNHNGTLENIASWRSFESGYFSHIYVGDVDNDGMADMAVSFLGWDVGNQGPTSIYRNNGVGLDQTAWWTSSDMYNSFDCAFGDVDLDGDLDLAVAAGDVYNGIESPTRVYRNNNGVFEATPYWTSADSTPCDACRWVDLDNDGYLDLVVGYRHKIAVFMNLNGTLEDSASWSTSEPGWILRIAVGDYNNDGYKDIAVACNGQMVPDDSRIEVYRNESGVLQSPPEYVMLTATNYCSCVEWGDVNNDSWLDLAAGGWWEPVVVFENSGGIIDPIPAWSWNGGSNLVCETVMWGDVGKRFLSTFSDYKSGDGVRKLFYFDYHPIQSFQEVWVNDMLVSLSDYAYDPLTGWISFKDAPPSGSNNIEIVYAYSQYPDLGVTNWYSSNYLFSNTTSGIEEDQISSLKSQDLTLEIYPNPFSLLTVFRYSLPILSGENTVVNLKIYDITGRMIKQFEHLSIAPTNHVFWNGTDAFGKRLPSGTYFVILKNGDSYISGKVVMRR